MSLERVKPQAKWQANQKFQRELVCILRCWDFLRRWNVMFMSVVGLFWLNRAGLPPAVLGLNILSKGVETGPTTT